MNLTALQNYYHEKAGGNNSNNTSIAAEVMFIVFRYFLLKRVNSLVLTLSCRSSFSCHFYHDVLDKMFHLWEDPDKVLQIVALDHYKPERIGGVRDRNLLLVDSYQSFLDIDIISYTSKLDYNEYNYIFLHIDDDLVKLHMQQILEYCWTHHMIQCSVQIQNAHGEVSVYSYSPYTAGHCGEAVPVLVNRYSGNSFEESKLFPRRLQDLNGCPLRAAVWNVPPFLSLSTIGNTTIISGGFEGKLILELATLMNFTIEVKIPPNDEQRGKTLGNTTTGALKMLIDRTADFSLGAFRQSVERDQVVSYTMNYYQTKYIFVALNSAYDFTSWQILIFPFQTDTWLLLFLTLTLAALKAFFAKRLFQQCSTYFHHHASKNCYLDIFATFIGMSASNMPWTIRGRIWLIKWLFFTLIIRTVYQGLIFHQIKTRVQNDLPQSQEELLESNFTAVMNDATADTLNYVSFMRQMQKTVLNTSSTVEPYSFIEKMKSKKLLAVTPREYLMFYANINKKPGVFSIVPQNLFSFATTIYLTKHSFLIDQFNEEIMWFDRAGLIEVWRRELDYEYYKGADLEENNVYGMHELHMIFVVHGVGMLIAGLVFFLEFISNRYTVLERIFKNALIKLKFLKQ